MLEEMKQLVRDKNICVLATIAGGKPYCSLMAYATNDAGTGVYMATHRHTRKFRNLTENPAVSLLIDTREDAPRAAARALTVEGTCRLIEERSERETARGLLLTKNPHLEEFLRHPGCEFVCVRISSFLLLKGLSEAHHATIG